MRTPIQLEFDFFADLDTHDNVVAVLFVIAGPIFDLRRQMRGGLTDRKCQKILDFLVTDAARLSFLAAILLEFGRPLAVSYEDFAQGVRQIIRAEIKAGRVKQIGQKRPRRLKPTDTLPT